MKLLFKSIYITGYLLAVSSHASAKQPNVIFFLADDMGYADVGCYGATKVKTPNIDKLAAEGIKFTDFHTGSSICSPSRAAFLTGAYPQRSGEYLGINENREQHWFLGMAPSEITIAEQFKAKDYDTYMIGKWHLGSEPEFHPLKQGFDHYYGMSSNYGHSRKFFDQEELVYPDTPLAQLTSLYTARVKKIISEQGDKPFFLYYAHNYPHTPYKAGKDFVKSSKDGVRGDIIQELDWGFGEMMKALEKAGVAENTIVIFTTDNGATSPQYSKPYRGTKYVTLEGGQRVPFILHYPALIKEAAESATPIVAMDLFPTLSEFISADIPTDRIYDGVSLVPLLKGGELERSDSEPFFYYNCENLQAVRIGDWKLHLPRTAKQKPWWDKSREFVNIEKPVLYNLSADPGESKDVANENPEVVERILATVGPAREELGEYMQRGSGQRPTGSVVEGAPVIGNPADWGTVDKATKERLREEHRKRHPEAKSKTNKMRIKK